MIKNHIVFSSYLDYRFTMSKAEGSYIWDDQSNKLLDFTSGWNVTNLGWNHPEVNDAFLRQAQKNVYAAMWMPDKIQEAYATALLAEYPGMDTVIRATGGTEANEVAVKLARAATGRAKIVGFKHTYHGQLFASMALGYLPEYVRAIEPLVPGFVQMDYPETAGNDTADRATIERFKSELDDVLHAEDVAAVFIEPGIVTGWGACRTAPQGFVETVRELTAKYGTMLVVDEVGTGFSRIGALFGIHAYPGVKPDIATFAKGITNGAGALGAVLTKAELVDNTISKANYTSTFGWMPTACAAALKTLEVHKRDKVWENASAMGDRLQRALRTKLAPRNVELRGVGLEICLDLSACTSQSKDLAAVVERACRQHGLNIIQGDGNIQLMPPCTISTQDLDLGAQILTDVITHQLQA